MDQPRDSGYPLVNIQKAIEHGPVEIVDFPIKNGDLNHSYVTNYQAGSPIFSQA